MMHFERIFVYILAGPNVSFFWEKQGQHLDLNKYPVVLMSFN